MIRTFKAAWDLFDNKFAYVNFIILNFWLLTDSVFGPHTVSDEVYEVAAKLAVKAATEGVNGMKC
jgi:hypothetical protein